MAEEIAPKVEEIRGLKFKRAVPVKLVDDAAARAHFKSRLARLWPKSRMRVEQTVYAHLGLVPATTDMEAALFSLLEEQAGGFYDPESDAFFVLNDMPRSSAPLLMAHELTHALDDQHHDIDKLIEKVKEDEDRMAVVGAVVEGSGMAVMSGFLVREIQAGRMTQEALMDLAQSEAGKAEKLRAAPELLQRTLLAPYLLGQSFVLRGDPLGAIKGVQPADLDRLFRDLPASTEQLLHPEKYWEGDKSDLPRAVAIPDLSKHLGDGWSLAGRGTLGELVIAIMTGSEAVDLMSAASGSPALWTNQAASGWGGDTWHLYSRGESHVTLLVTRWDTEADAQELESGLKPAEARRVLRHGDTVILVVGDARERSQALGQAALASLSSP